MKLTAKSDFNRLNNIGRQLVMVSPQSFVDVIKKFFRILKTPGQTVHHARLQHVLGAVALANAVDCSLIDGSHHIALGLQFRAAHHGTRTGDDPRVVVAELQELVHRIDASADPGAGEVIQFWIAYWRYNIAGSQHVGNSKKNIDVSARVGCDKVTVVDLFSIRL